MVTLPVAFSGTVTVTTAVPFTISLTTTFIGASYLGAVILVVIVELV